MKLVGYARVSGDNQVENTSLDDQERRMAAWATAHGHELVRVIRDEGLSAKGGSLAWRDGLTEALALLDELDGIIVLKVDRLARDVFDGFALVGEITRSRGKVLVSIEEQFDTSSAMGRAMLGLLLSFADLEREAIAKRMRYGREAKRRAGGYHAGQPPYGWRASEGSLVPDEREQAVIMMAQRLRRSGKSFTVIAERLNAAGYTTKLGKAWSHKQVASILRPGVNVDNAVKLAAKG
jgi:site-specific DNA recombinase